ncbi:hypothetical protein HG536_0F02220 [Torulaspora globosa]|uniref:MICOS complex subunit MIC12 n=1 Tax=Torulaspora globosa TaxID=48254 RepID=A0A7G3ZK61_9SACH|nr:uncharacterized protein HG536_0F02220 [Torulaspora globosa]QLL33897.1 hypothetical protein HG536_0F02220 [Torulaspora globosa]
MSKLLKLGSITLVSTALATSYYFYAVDRDGYHYNRSVWKKVSDRTRGLLDRKQDLERSSPHTTELREVIQRPVSETFKDLWNEQVREIVRWVYSLGN